MKNLSKITLATALFTILTINAFAQETTFDLVRNVNMFTSDSEVKNISLNVQQNTSSLFVEIVSGVQYGSLTIEIYNPKKEKIGEFSVESQLPTSDKVKKEYTQYKDGLGEFVSGQIQKYVNSPTSGKWIIKIIPKEAIGNIKISSRSLMND
jgi:hypothetical protein